MTSEQSMEKTGRTPLLNGLRRTIARLEGRSFTPLNGPARTGDEGLPRALNAAITAPGLHEIAVAAYGDGPAAIGFCCAILARRAVHGQNLPVLWCTSAHDAWDGGQLYGPGMVRFGLAPARVILATARREQDVLWALEEGLRSSALDAVAGLAATAGLTEARRLSLAAQDHGAACFLIRPPGASGASAAWTRWRIAAAPSPPQPLDPDAPGGAAWSVTLERDRGAPPQHFAIGWDHETHTFRLAAAMADRPDAPGGAPSAGLALARTG